MRDARKGRFRIEGKDQDVHLAVERVLTGKLGDLGRRVHTARSRNDQVALDALRPLRLCMRQFAIGDAVGPIAEIFQRHAAELAGDYTTRLGLMEDMKLLPLGAVWDYYCLKMGAPVGEAWLAEVKAYEKAVLSKR